MKKLIVENNMQVEFEHTDLFMDVINNKVKMVELADYIINNPSLVQEIAMLVKGGVTLERFNKLKLTFLLKHMRNNEMIELADKISEVYNLALTLKDEELGGKFTLQDKIALIRGSILETLIFRLIESRHKIVNQNCQIKIDNCLQMLPNKHPQTMDVVGLDKIEEPQRGEIYETKVGPMSINVDDLKFIEHLRVIINDACPNVIIGLVCFDGKAFINGRLKKLKVKSTYANYIIGFENLPSLWSYHSVKKIIS